MTNSYQLLVEESEVHHTSTTHFSSRDISKICTVALDNLKFGVLPIFRFILKAEISSRDIVLRAMKKISDEVKTMVVSITNFSEYIRAQLQGNVAMLRETKVMGTELIQAALEEGSSHLVELFLETLEIEGGIIDISDLLQRSGLWYHPDWLRKMFQRGADLQLCRRNPIKVVLQKEYTQSCIELDMIRILLENESAFPFDIPHIHILNEVIRCTLKCQNGTIDTLKIVCENVDFRSPQVCDHEGRTPWHLALSGKRKKVSIEVCKMLSKYPIDPRMTDNNGKRPDFGLKDNDERVNITRDKIELMEKLAPVVTLPGKQKRTMDDTGEESLGMTESGYCPRSSLGEKEGEIADGYTAETNTISQSLKQVGEDTSTMIVTREPPSKLDHLEYKEGNYQLVPKHYLPLETGNESHDYTESDESACAGVADEEEEHVKLKPPHEYINPSRNRVQQWENQGATAVEIPGVQEETLWNIECSKKVEKVLRQSEEHIKKQFYAKLKILSEGEFMGNTRHCKSVTTKKGAELYETRLSDKGRIIWQIVPKRYSKQAGVYKEIIRVWAIVLDHDNIYHCVQTVLRDTIFQATEKLKTHLKCTYGTSNVHNNKREPQTFEADTQCTEHEINDSAVFNPVTDL